jgi:hypothetical protein
VDSAGARTLRWRLEQQAHWRQASAVLEGRQPSVDPDGEELERVEAGRRVYRAQIVHGQVVQRSMELIDGVWESRAGSDLATPAAPTTTGAQIAKVT